MILNKQILNALWSTTSIKTSIKDTTSSFLVIIHSAALDPKKLRRQKLEIEKNTDTFEKEHLLF